MEHGVTLKNQSRGRGDATRTTKEDDMHIQEEIIKKENIGESSRGKTAQGINHKHSAKERILFHI